MESTGHYMEGMSLKLTSVVVRRLLGPLSMFGAMAGTSWTTVLTEGLTHFRLPIPPPPTCLSLIHATRDNTVVVKRVVQNSTVLAS